MSENIAAEPRREMARRLGLASRLDALLALPLLYKVLFANSVVILIGATLGTYLATYLQGQNRPIMIVGFVISGLLISVAINFVLLKLALHPLHQLRETMGQVQGGDWHRQATVTGQDPDADQLAIAFNTMLAALDDLSKSRASQILHAQEQERKRIARELHDETSQVLTSLLISLALLEETISSEPARERIADTRALAHQTLRAVRNLSLDLRPSALDDLGLLPALRWYIKEYQQNCGIEVEFSGIGLKERLPSEMETAIYRIVQEALTNSAKHAQARKVWVTVSEDGGQARVHVRDDGRGFDVETVLKTPWQDRGLGLAGMMERAALLDGGVRFSSTPGIGTAVDVNIPLARGARDKPTSSPAQADQAAQAVSSASSA